MRITRKELTQNGWTPKAFRLFEENGASSQGMAVNEYGEGGLACLHSTLHPVGAERMQVPDHPEVLLVPAKDQEVRLIDVEYTLEALSSDFNGYERSEAPANPRRGPTCFHCGEEAHIARECPERFGHDDGDVGYARAGMI